MTYLTSSPSFLTMWLFFQVFQPQQMLPKGKVSIEDGTTIGWFLVTLFCSQPQIAWYIAATNWRISTPINSHAGTSIISYFTPSPMHLLAQRIIDRLQEAGLKYTISSWKQYTGIIYLTLIVAMLTILQPARSVTEKFRRDLKSQDFVLISQENKEYKQLVNILQEREAILTNRVAQLQRVNGKLENERDEYQTISNELAIRIQQYESIKAQLLQEYRLLKKEIDRSQATNKEREAQIHQLTNKNSQLQENMVFLEQKAKTDAMVIEELRQHVSKLEREIVDKKIQLFSQMIACPRQELPRDPPRKQAQIQSGPRRASHGSTFKTSYNYCSSKHSKQNSKNSSNINSISFSLVSKESASRKDSRVKNHNKSIYV